MPHQCTSCNRQFDDGATEMLSGCPNCGGNRFQFIPEGASAPDPGDAPPDNLIEAEPDPDYDPSESDWFGGEDRAQSDARSGMIDPDHLPDHVTEPEEDESDDGPDLEDLREELADQFGSIKIVSRGEYELNLMELYERKECIIELQENGRYAIQVPEALAGGGPAPGDVPNR